MIYNEPADVYVCFGRNGDGSDISKIFSEIDAIRAEDGYIELIHNNEHVVAIIPKEAIWYLEWR